MVWGRACARGTSEPGSPAPEEHPAQQGPPYTGSVCACVRETHSCRPQQGHRDSRRARPTPAVQMGDGGLGASGGPGGGPSEWTVGGEGGLEKLATLGPAQPEAGPGAVQAGPKASPHGQRAGEQEKPRGLRGQGKRGESEVTLTQSHPEPQPCGPFPGTQHS